MITSEKLIKKFLEGNKAINSSMRSTGDKLFSYFTCIAQKTNNGFIVNSTKYSDTTSKQQGILIRELKKGGYNYVETKKYVPKETEDLTDFL